MADGAYMHADADAGGRTEERPGLADGEVAALALEAARRRLRTFEDATVAWSSADLTRGRRARSTSAAAGCDDRHEILVVNWQAPAARPFYTATPVDPQRVTLRRRFRTTAGACST